MSDFQSHQDSVNAEAAELQAMGFDRETALDIAEDDVTADESMGADDCLEFDDDTEYLGDEPGNGLDETDSLD